MNNYDDIIDLPHFEPKNHPRMSNYNRSSQFAPFAALTGYSEAVEETGRLTDEKPELDDDEKNIIDMKLQIINEHLNEKPIINLLYFEKDLKKKGGKYLNHQGLIKKIDLIERLIIFTDNTKINLDSIIDIQTALINNLEL